MRRPSPLWGCCATRNKNLYLFWRFTEHIHTLCVSNALISRFRFKTFVIGRRVYCYRIPDVSEELASFVFMVTQKGWTTLKLLATYSVTVYQCARHDIPESLNIHKHSYENLKCSVDEFLLSVVSSVLFFVLKALLDLQVASPVCRSYLYLVTVTILYSNIYP